MELSMKAQQSLEFSRVCFLQGFCTIKEFVKAIKTIYQDDLAEQIALLAAQGMTEKNAIRRIYNLDYDTQQI